ncbi:PC-Esterase [Macleaya cordata]|uniref:PC-Esterase n=1 Tax=Macleaya cordata TaxID=56857 RepID=A0A200Q7U0_MACCD|nr:PC-Esterase [Macleaya cordata]
MKYGRPDTDFLKWRWKPDDCELPIFNPYQFLELLRAKSLAFVGDSVGRNQMQSLLCLLSRVEYPVDVSYTSSEQFKRWKYTNYNFTIANFWTPYLVRAKEEDPNGPTHTGLFNLYLDEFDEEWTTQIDEFDYLIISGGHWFFRPSMFYQNNQLVGCHYCLEKNVTDLTFYYGYRKAFRTAFKAINSLKNFKGTTFLRTFAPSHFENGLWNEGGNCVRTRPFSSNETRLEGHALEMYMTQLEEFRVAEKEGKKRGLKFRLLDTTQATLLRPDGHPSRYGHLPEENVTLYNDCVHWCLPGPIDAWNDLLLEMLKMENEIDEIFFSLAFSFASRGVKWAVPARHEAQLARLISVSCRAINTNHSARHGTTRSKPCRACRAGTSCLPCLVVPLVVPLAVSYRTIDVSVTVPATVPPTTVPRRAISVPDRAITVPIACQFVPAWNGTRHD